MSVAGKSGTTSNNVDVWFVGFTPYYTAGVWAGCDENQTLSDNGGTSFHKDIWRKIMTKVSEGRQDIGFPVPESVETAVVCRKSGKLPIPGVCDHDPRGDSTYTEYFAKGTVPTEACDHHTTVTVCRDSGLLPTPNCPTTTRVALIIPSGQSPTDDSQYAAPSATCNIHGGVNPIIGSEAPTEGATDNQDVGVAPNSNHPVVTPRQNNNVTVGVAPGDDHTAATQSPSPVITPSKPDKKNKKKKPSEVVTPETTAPPAHIKSTPPTKSDDDSDVLHGPGVSAPKNDGPHASPGPSVSTEGPGGQASPILVGPGE